MSDLPLIHLCHENLDRSEEYTICAVGPSLWGYDFEYELEHGVRILAVNEAVLLCPRNAVCVMWDLPPARRLGLWFQEKGVQPCECIVEADLWFNRRGPGSEWIAKGPTNAYYRREDVQKADARYGTGAVCLLIAHAFGARRARLVGFDAFWDPDKGQGMAEPVRAILERLEGSEGLQRGSPAAYQRHAGGIRRLADRLGLELVRGS